MNADRHALTLLALASLLLAAPAGLAQTLDEQAQAAAGHASSLAEDASEDPDGFTENATDPAWHAEHANWTHRWSCETATAADEDAGEALSKATGCPQPENAQAGNQEEEDDEEQRPRADAEEAEQAETAFLDLLAAIDEYQQDTQEDPEEAPEHTLTLLNRTLTVLERLIDPPRILASSLADAGAGALDAVQAAQAPLQDAGEAAASLPLALADTLAAAGNHAADATHHAASGLGDAATTAIDQAKDTLDAVRDAVLPSEDPAHAPTEQAPQGVDRALETDPLLEPLDRIQHP